MPDKIDTITPALVESMMMFDASAQPFVDWYEFLRLQTEARNLQDSTLIEGIDNGYTPDEIRQCQEDAATRFDAIKDGLGGLANYYQVEN